MVRSSTRELYLRLYVPLLVVTPAVAEFDVEPAKAVDGSQQFGDDKDDDEFGDESAPMHLKSVVTQFEMKADDGAPVEFVAC